MPRIAKKAISNVASIESGSKARPESEKISPAGSLNGASLEERIRARAYELYQERGFQDGSAEQDWQRAEEELKGRAAKRSA